jgi:hypothetical protein
MVHCYDIKEDLIFIHKRSSGECVGVKRALCMCLSHFVGWLEVAFYLFSSNLSVGTRGVLLLLCLHFGSCICFFQFIWCGWLFLKDLIQVCTAAVGYLS